MKLTFKLSALLLFVLYASFANSSEITRSDAPQIQVKKKSIFKEDASRKDFPKFFLKSAFNTLTGETLVVWKEDGFDLRMQVTGRILGPTGKATTKKITPTPGDSGQGFGATHNPVTNEYLVVYTRDGSIAGQRFDAKAKAIGKEFEIIPHTSISHNNHPHVIFDPHTDGYAIVWDRTEGTSAALLDRSGKLTATPVTLKNNPDASGYYDDWGNGGPGRYPRVHGFAFLPSGDKLLVVFQQRFNPLKGDYWLAALAPSLKDVSLSRINQKTVDFTRNGFWITSRGGWGASLATLPDGSAVVYFADETKVNRRKIDVDGVLSGKASPAFSGAPKKAHLYDPEVAFSTISSGTTGLLIATELQRDKEKIVWAQALNSKGLPSGQSVKLDIAVPDSYLFASELMPLRRKPTDKLFQYIYLQFHSHVELGTEEYQFLRFDLDVQP